MTRPTPEIILSTSFPSPLLLAFGLLAACSAVPVRPEPPAAPETPAAPVAQEAVSYATCQVEMLANDCLPPLAQRDSPAVAIENRDALAESCELDSLVLDCATEPCIVLADRREVSALRDCVDGQLVAIPERTSAHQLVPVFWAIPPVFEKVGAAYPVLRRADARLRRLERSAEGNSSTPVRTAATCDDLVEALGCQGESEYTEDVLRAYLADVALARQMVQTACPSADEDLVIDCTEVPCVAAHRKAVPVPTCSEELPGWWGPELWSGGTTSSFRVPVLPFDWAERITWKVPTGRPVPHPEDGQMPYFQHASYEGLTLLAGPPPAKPTE